MKNYPVYLRNMLNSVIREMAKHPEKFCRNPGKDFTRNRKLPFGKVLSLLLKMGGHANNAVDTIFAKLQGLIEKGDRARWDLAIGFLDLLQEKSVAVTNCVASIFDLSINHRRPDPWEYDGVNRLYERMWPYLDDAQKEVLVSSLHVHYQQCRQVEETGLPNFFYLSNDIHQMILWQAPLLDNSTKINTLKIILDMHTNWITSLNKRVYTPRYSCVVEADENATWKDV